MPKKVQNINGALVAFYPIPGLNSTCLSLVVRAGSWYEMGNKWGEMHLLEHLFFQGTEKFPTKESLDDFMEDNGIICNALTGGSKIEIVMRFPNTSIDSALLLLSQMVFYPTLSQLGIEKESKVISREYTDKWSKVDIRFYRKIQEQLFGSDHIYIRDGLGDPQYVESITESGLKETHSRLFISSNMYLGLAGGLDREETIEKLHLIFPKSIDNPSKLSAKPIQSSQKTLVVNEENIKSTSIKVTWLTKGMDDYSLSEKITLSFGSYLLGGSRRSALNKKIRDELGLAYSVSTNIFFLPTSGWLQVSTSTKPDSKDEVVAQIKKIISEFISQDVDNISFQRAKKYVKWQRLLQYDSGPSAASYLSDSLYWDSEIVSQGEFEAIVDGITQEDLKMLLGTVTINEPFVMVMEPKK